ncbi:LuxR C-terminal-related transcriptional regulator [Spirosoma fluviale]|uniref:Regulatory protein, luxR family n=1 Tax=Spirosoma fluviale TaxID=1597977 RepID=A0A286FIJ2_9BACT|nr:helix-turn-helix transcriptional regulator [Spirosoma fluviale]SOD83028.1 regulatory protein, luxR family [Spirosoma fluviale]
MFFPTSFPIHGSYLTAREAEVLWLGLQGLTILQISERIVRSPKTITRHRENIRTRFGLTGYHRLQLFALKIRPELEKWVK